MKIVVAHGTFDIIHYGHLNYLEKAKKLGDYLIVLVTSDRFAKKYGKDPFFDEKTRLKMISSFRCVDKAMLRDEHITGELLEKLNTDIFTTIYEKYQNYSDIICEVKLIERTKGISTTMIKEHLKDYL